MDYFHATPPRKKKKTEAWAWYKRSIAERTDIKEVAWLHLVCTMHSPTLIRSSSRLQWLKLLKFLVIAAHRCFREEVTKMEEERGFPPAFFPCVCNLENNYSRAREIAGMTRSREKFVFPNAKGPSAFPLRERYCFEEADLLDVNLKANWIA